MTPAQEAQIDDFIKELGSDLLRRDWPSLIFHCLELAGHVIRMFLHIRSVELDQIETEAKPSDPI